MKIKNKIVLNSSSVIVFCNDNKKIVYFAHPFDKMGSKREEMIIKTLEERGYYVLDPFMFENELLKKYGVDNYYNKPIKEFATDIVSRDFKEVELCDEVFAWIPEGTTTIGTIFEITWAYELGKKITILVDKPQPFLLFYADKLYLGYKDFKNDKVYEWK